MLGWDAWSKHANTVEQAMRCTTLQDARAIAIGYCLQTRVKISRTHLPWVGLGLQ
jgi:hypothetical protein